MKITSANYMGTIRALGQARSDQNLALRRLSSGLRVEKGVDGPAALIASQTLRAERASLEQASQTAQRATGLVDVADAALDAMGQAARKLEQLFLESRAAPLSSAEQKAIQNEADGLIRHIDHLSESTVYAGRRVFKEDPTYGIDNPPANIGEFNIASGDHNWQQVNFIESYNNPIVVAGPTSSNGADPNHVRLRNVTSTGFEFKIEEYGFYDGITPTETFGWMVVNQGIHTLDDGTVIEAGQVQADHVMRTYSFANTGFTSNPLLFSTMNGDLPSDPAEPRARNVNTAGFQLYAEESELERSNGATRARADEAANYIALQTPAGVNGSGNTAAQDPAQGIAYTAEQTARVHNHNFRNENHGAGAVAPVLIADNTTRRGGDSMFLRHRNLSGNSVEFQIDEEQSLNTEIGHTTEEIDLLVFDKPGVFDATPEVNLNNLANLAPPRPSDPDPDDQQTTWVFLLGARNPQDAAALRIKEVGSHLFTNGLGTLAQLRSGENFELSDPTSNSDVITDILKATREEILDMRGHISRFEKDVVQPAISNITQAAIETADATATIEDADYAVEVAAESRAVLLQQSTSAVLPIAFERDRIVNDLVDSTTLPTAVGQSVDVV